MNRATALLTLSSLNPRLTNSPDIETVFQTLSLIRETDALGITLFGVFTVFNKCSLFKLAHERGTWEALVNSVNGPMGSTKCGVFFD
jgi:hypothetical protein